MDTGEPALDVPVDVASALIGAPVDSLAVVGGGRNSRVYRVRSAGRDFALKQYPSRVDDPRDRLGTEVGALGLMERHRFEAVPRVIAADSERGFALLSWLDGVPVVAVGDADIDQAAAFLSAIHALRGARAMANDRLASEACLSGSEIERQVAARVATLQKVPASEAELHRFLHAVFVPALAGYVARAKERMTAAQLDFAAELPQEKRTLVPSDFGFHNSLRRPDGRLVFFDFEYFGWDDPVKLTSDVMLHPGTPVAAPLVQRFRAAAERLYGESDASFAGRLAAFYPLFGLRWVLILLNEFLPDRWQRRLLAGAADGWEAAKARQLARARALLAQIEHSEDRDEHGH